MLIVKKPKKYLQYIIDTKTKKVMKKLEKPQGLAAMQSAITGMWGWICFM